MTTKTPKTSQWQSGAWESRTYYEVAVFWPKAGEADKYGGREHFGTEEGARASVEMLVGLGYQRDCIHIRKVTIEVLPIK